MSTSRLSVSTLARYDCVVVALVGEIDAPQLVHNALLAVTHETPDRLVVDLSGVDYIVTAAVDVLLDIQGDLIAHGSTMALVWPRPLVAKLLELTGADERIPVYYNLREAVTGHVAVRLSAA